MSNTKRLVGDNGIVFDISLEDTPVVGDGTTVLPKGYYRIDKVATGTTGFSGKSATAGALVTGAEKGYIYISDGVNTTLATGDEATLINLKEKICYLTSFTSEITRAEISLTTMCDTVDYIESGLTTITGSIEGIEIAGESQGIGSIKNSGITVVEQKLGASGSYDLNKVTGKGLLFFVANNKISRDGEPLSFSVFGGILTNVNFLSIADKNSGQTFSASVRIQEVEEIEPAIYNVIDSTIADTIENIIS